MAHRVKPNLFKLDVGARAVLPDVHLPKLGGPDLLHDGPSTDLGQELGGAGVGGAHLKG